MSTPEQAIGPLVPYGLKPGTPAYTRFVRNLATEFSANLEEVLPKLTHWVGAYCTRIDYPDPDDALGEALCWSWRHAADAPADEDQFASWIYRSACQVAWRAKVRHGRTEPLEDEKGIKEALIGRITHGGFIVSRHSTGTDQFLTHVEAATRFLGGGRPIALSTHTQRVLDALGAALEGYGAMSERAAIYTAVLTMLAERVWPATSPYAEGRVTVMRGARALLDDDKRTHDELLIRVMEKGCMTKSAARNMVIKTIETVRIIVGESARKVG